MICRSRGCIFPIRNGFRKCVECLRGNTPDKRGKERGDEEE